MKAVKIIFIVLEICCLVGVIKLAFSDVSEDMEFFRAVFISLFSLLAVALQKEQQSIEWEDDEDVQSI